MRTDNFAVRKMIRSNIIVWHGFCINNYKCSIDLYIYKKFLEYLICTLSVYGVEIPLGLRLYACVMLLVTFRSVVEYLTKIIGLTIQKIAKGGIHMKKTVITLWGCSKLGMSQPKWKMVSKSDLYFRDSAEA